VIVPPAARDVGNERPAHVTADVDLSLEDLKHLVEWAGHLREEATQCAEARHWRAAFVMCAAAVEAGLAATVFCLAPELRAQGHLKPKQSITNLTLAPLVAIARNAGWLPSVLDGSGDESEALVGEVGDAIRFLVKLRNLAAHPMAHARDLPWLDFREPTMADWFPICLGIADEVFRHLSLAITAS